MPTLSVLLIIDPQISKGFDLALELTKQVLTLSVGILTITITFTKDIVKIVSNNLKIFLGLSWAAFFISILFGILHLMGLTGALIPTDITTYKDIAVKEVFIGSTTRMFSILQLVFFLIGTFLITMYGIKGFTSKNA